MLRKRPFFQKKASSSLPKIPIVFMQTLFSKILLNKEKLITAYQMSRDAQKKRKKDLFGPIQSPLQCFFDAFL